MTFRKSILLLVALATIAALVACSSSSTPPITLSLNSVPTSLAVNSQTPVVASVNNDKANGGVVWTCTTTPTGSPCGTFNPATTASGASTTYTAPNFILPAGTTVTITATSATNSAIAQSSQPITINANTLADGNYIFSVTGSEITDQSNYSVTGVITIAGGVITGGEQDFVDTDANGPLHDSISAQPAGACTATTIVATCITTAPNGTAGDGNLYIYLATGDTAIGVNGLETFSGTVLPLNQGSNAGKAAIAEFDASATGSGWIERQSGALSLTATPGPGSFAFVLANNGLALSVGGIINVDDLPATSGGPATVGTISGTGSIWDGNQAGSIVQGSTFTASSVSAPDAWGTVTFTLNSPDLPEALVLAGYQISSSKIQLVEAADDLGGGLNGIAYGQTVPSHSGVSGFTIADATNTYVIGMQGADVNFVLQSAEQLSIAADGSVTGFLDYSDLAENSQAASPDPVAAAASTVDATGRITIPNVNDSADEGGVAYNVQLYLDGNGHALAITLDETDSQAGIGFQQSGASSIAASSFAGPYGMGVTGWDGDENGEFDSVGPVVADGSSTFAGFSDVNWLDWAGSPVLVWNNSVSGGFGASSAAGIFTGSVSGVDILNCPAFGVDGAPGCTADVFNFYLIDSTGDNIAIETDGAQLTFGYFAQQ